MSVTVVPNAFSDLCASSFHHQQENTADTACFLQKKKKRYESFFSAGLNKCTLT